MSIFEIGANQALHNFERSSKAMDSASRELSTGKRINAAKDDPVGWSKAQQDRASVSGTAGINENLSLVATNVRIADNVMDTIGRLMAQMKASLERIVKNYPPYPIGSPERSEYLRTFNGLRNQIEQLTIPPQDEGARKIMADPAVVPGAGDWEFIATGNGERVMIRGQQVHPGPTGLDIPALPDTATDADVAAAIVNLDRARQTLSDRRAGLGIDAAAVARTEAWNAKLIGVHTATGEKLVNADMNQAAAEQKSVEVQRELALESVRGLTDMRSRFLELLG